MTVSKLFWTDPYLSECEAEVTSADGGVITLSRTVAYAFEGGQQSDSGTIGGYEILEAVRDGKEIFYHLTDGHGLKKGDSVHVSIDWEKRYRIMRLHFAAELVLELVYQNFGHPEKIGANITDEKARVDFMWDGNISETFPVIEPMLKDMIDKDTDITSAFDDEETERRYWKIEGFAKVPCGGTHIRKTSEVGRLGLKRVNPGKGKERIEITLKD
ncbi:MAG: alanyl-tRNA editing protein [Deferribacterales bacterium]